MFTNLFYFLCYGFSKLNSFFVFAFWIIILFCIVSYLLFRTSYFLRSVFYLLCFLPPSSYLLCPTLFSTSCFLILVSYLLFPNSCFLPLISYLLVSSSCFLPPDSYLLIPTSWFLPPVFLTSCFLLPVFYLLFPTFYFLHSVFYLLFSTS